MSEFEVGDLFADRYEIVKELGRGGMGMVYLVIDQKTQKRKHRALKMLLPKYATNKQAVRRFAREVNAARQLRHPSIVKIYDAGKGDGALYYVMEYVEGKSVRAWMRERKKKTGKAFGLGSTVRVLGMLCSALDHAHNFTIHRDLSPANVMGMRDGRVKLLDFGLAKLDSSDAERGPAADENILNSTRATDFIAPKNDAMRLFRRAVLERARDHPFARGFVNSGRLSLPCGYTDWPLSTPDGGDFE